MVFSFARVGAALAMKVEDYYGQGKRWWVRLHEKGGKRHDMPCHHNLEAYLDAYLEAAGIGERRRAPSSARPRTHRRAHRNRHGPGRRLPHDPPARRDAGIDADICCHTFRATGITAYLENGGTLENAQAMAAHESPRTTKLYDRTGDEITLDEVERKPGKIQRNGMFPSWSGRVGGWIVAPGSLFRKSKRRDTRTNL